MPDTPTILLVAGEASGDMHAAALARALRQARPELRLLGMGGPRMAAQGVDNRFPLTDLAVMGFVEVLAHARALHKAWRAAMELLTRSRPDVVVLVDYPGFNLRLAKAAKRLGIRVVYYISPQVWAWKPGRAKVIRDYVDRLLVILPFEVDWYAQRGIEAVFVGHPLLERITMPPKDGTCGKPPVVALLPGSRASDWRRIFPPLAGAAEEIARRLPGATFRLPLAETAQREWLSRTPCAVPIEVIDTGYQARAACDVAVVKSGTTTVEHALLGLPSVIVYRTSPLTYWLAKRLVRIDHIGMVNLIAGGDVCPELIQHEASPTRIADEVVGLVQDDERRHAMVEQMGAVRRALGGQDGPGASVRAARETLAVLDRV